MYILNVFFLFYSKCVWYFGWPHSNFVAMIAVNADDLSHDFDNNSCRSLDVNELSKSPHSKDVVPHLEEVNLAFAIVPRLVELHRSCQ